jgi:hypothetical protein
MMDEHVHEWRIIRKWTGDTLVKCDLCDESMRVSEINRRLNATERLSAWLRVTASVIESHQKPEADGFMSNEALFAMIVKEALQHAEILEGK